MNEEYNVKICKKTFHLLKTDEYSSSAHFVLSKNQNHKSRGQLNKIFRLKNRTKCRAVQTEEMIYQL